MTKPIIREATEKDIFDILVLAREFSREAPSTHKWDKDKTEAFCQAAIHNTNTTLLILEEDGELQGAIVGLINEMYMSQTVIATELAWFVSKDYRGKRGSILLLKTFEEWAKNSNADYVCMGDIHGIASLENLYTRMGYSKCETTYMKEV